MARLGRPTFYNPEFADHAHKLCLMRATIRRWPTASKIDNWLCNCR